MNRTDILFVTVMTVLATIGFAVATASAATQTSQFQTVMAAAVANNGAIPPNGGMSAIRLESLLNDADPSNDPLVVDLRTADEYATGHIPGAMNIHYRTLGDSNVLTGLDSALTAHVAAGGDGLVVTYGNTHHFKAITTYLDVQGFDVKTLNHGLAEWTKNEIAAPGRFKWCTSFDPVTGKGTGPAGCTSNNFPTTTGGVNASSLSGEDYPDLDYPGDLADITRAAYDARYGDPSKPEFRMDPRELYDLLDDNQDGVIAGPGDDTSNDPFVLSNRGTLWGPPIWRPVGPYYVDGHIIGAVAVDWIQPAGRQELQQLDRVDFMPQDREVVHHCWVGQSQQYGNSWYHLLGYTARTLDWGMRGWSGSATVRGADWYHYKYDTSTTDFPLETGSVKITPSTLNTKSKGDYVTAMITLGNNPNFDTSDVDLNSIKLEDAVTGSASVESAKTIKVKFNRADVIGLVSTGSATLTVSYDILGNPYIVSDTINVL